MHVIAIPVAWIFFNAVKNKIVNYIKFHFIWFFFIIIFYIIILVPAGIFSKYLFGSISAEEIVSKYLIIINVIKLEAFITALITSFLMAFILVYKKFKGQEEKFRNIFNSGHNAIFIHDLNGEILDVNETMLRMYVLKSKEEALKYSIKADYSHMDNQVDMLSQMWEKVISGESQEFEWKARRPFDGSVFDVQVNLKKINYGEKDVILATVRDVTAQKKAEKTLIESEAK
ncbi:MAG: PAS domain S-box protein, partial [Calditrichia bacterium]|nr:PAS domain S-box protein [Calditrichia bacterium]